MSKVHILDSYYKQGHSRVIKSSPYGVVCGCAELNEDDAEIGNQWDGCKIAEMRADIEIQKRRTKKLNHRAAVMDEVIDHLGTEMLYHPDRYNSVEKIIKLIGSMVCSAHKQAEDNQEKLARMQEALPTKIDALLNERYAVREQIEKMRENKK